MAKSEVGNRYGRLVVQSRAGSSNRAITWSCQCDCGNTKVVRGTELRKGNSQSCGCLQRELASALAKTRPSPTLSHGMSRTPTYVAWCGMIRRCTKIRSRDFLRYGGRGIKVCERWLKFENFLADMGERPTGLSIDRIDVNGNYEPGNCRWATEVEQQNNKRTNTYYTLNGVTQSLSKWAKALKLKYTELQYRAKTLGFQQAVEFLSK